jgi:nucleotide-binding universal stress UspA family protein
MSILCGRSDLEHSIPAQQAAESLGRCMQTTVLETAALDQQMLGDLARENRAFLVVVSDADTLVLGRRAERLARRLGVPVLIARDGAAFGDFADKKRPLKIVIAASRRNRAALAWAAHMSALGPCALVLVHLFWSLDESERLGLSSTRSYVEPDPLLTRMLERDFEKEFEQLSLPHRVRMRMELHEGRIADRLSEIVQEENADLVVIGAGCRENLAMYGSMARVLLDHTRASVVCVPESGNRAAKGNHPAADHIT